MEKRAYGNTGEKLSVVGFGGILVKDETTSESARLVSQAIDRDVNYFDVAPQYGNAQEMLGPALEPYRKNVFLACKTLERKAEGAEAELHDSLKKLKTDYFDLYQFHSVTVADDVNQILGPGGALEAVRKAQEKGLIKYIGFSAHTEEAAVRLMDAFDFQSVLFPLNWTCWLKGDFGRRIVAKAEEKGVAMLALKIMAKRKWGESEEREYNKTWYRPVESYEEAKVAVRFSLSQPITAGPSPGHEKLFLWMCDAAEEYSPLTEEEERQLKARAEALDPIFSVHESRWEE
jgi:aryl-alcohol dehydrogenase-like predicted oxidoreductase